MIRPFVIVGAERTGSWDVDTAPIESSGAGTTYTAWVTLSGSPPTAAGYFRVPSAGTLKLAGIGSATVTLELGSGGVAFASGIFIRSMRSVGLAGYICLNTDNVDTLVNISYSNTLAQLRFAVVADVPIELFAIGSTLYKL
jgi:hypothetical protein